MTSYTRNKFAIAAVLLAAATIMAAATPMHNADVVRLVRQGASVTDVLAAVNSSQPGFALSPADVAYLQQDGVPQGVIQAMTERQLAVGGQKVTAAESV